MIEAGIDALMGVSAEELTQGQDGLREAVTEIYMAMASLNGSFKSRVHHLDSLQPKF